MSTVHRPCRCATLAHNGPLPRLVRGLWRVVLWLARGVTFVLAMVVQRLREPPLSSEVVVLAQVANAPLANTAASTGCGTPTRSSPPRT